VLTYLDRRPQAIARVLTIGKRGIALHGVVGALEPFPGIAAFARAMLVGLDLGRDAGWRVRFVAGRSIGRADGCGLALIEGRSLEGDSRGGRAVTERD